MKDREKEKVVERIEVIQRSARRGRTSAEFSLAFADEKVTVALEKWHDMFDDIAIECQDALNELSGPPF